MAGVNLFDMLKQANNGQGITQVAKQFGLDENQAEAAIGALLPALSSGLKRNAAQPGGLPALLETLNQGNHEQYLDQPETLERPETLDDGNAILGHLLGSKDVSRAAASKAASSTGLSDGLLKQMLPILATMAMGALSKQSKDSGIGGMLAGALSGSSPQGGNGFGGGLGGLVGGMLGGASGKSGGPDLGMLGNLLDADKDGSSMDDIFDMLGKR